MAVIFISYKSDGLPQEFTSSGALQSVYSTVVIVTYQY
jgi:hypothetical protein